MTATILTTKPILAQNQDFKELVASAIKAPSGHNTQPWLFRLQENAIEVRPNLKNELAVVDPENRELYISIGCAVENLCVAATQKGYRPTPTIQKENDSTYIIRVGLEKQKATDNPLFAPIAVRQTNRSVYNGQMIAADTVQLIQEIAKEEGVKFYMYKNGEAAFDTLTEYIRQGNEIQMTDKDFKNELLNWIRFNKSHAAQMGNGLTTATMGSPGMPKFIGKPLVKAFLKPKTQNKSDIRKVESSSHLVLFTISENTPKEWILLGQTLERFLLETTRLGIVNAYMNQPCELKPLVEKIKEKLLPDGEYPMMIVRLGYASPMPYSPRKSVESVIIP
ncbi:Acg family FMN-binding oxidoreductase [uncultured Bacteroides sp.]|uniref:Acg family FMN-binding oxidoreductase n=1 Tax=uncultured Bacteroides sp. TaxID=162156 RepID=UPI002AA72175|nr:nitroreductase [uncultured Bacteroides sp.]